MMHWRYSRVTAFLSVILTLNDAQFSCLLAGYSAEDYQEIGDAAARGLERARVSLALKGGAENQKSQLKLVCMETDGVAGGSNHRIVCRLNIVSEFVWSKCIC